MNIDVNLLTTTTACDSMIEILEAKKLQIQRKARNLEEALVRKVRTIQDIKAGIISIRATITGYQSTITLITNDKEQRSLELKIEREETKLKSLQNREANYSAFNMIEDQVNHNQIEAQIPVLDHTIAILNTRKNEL